MLAVFTRLIDQELHLYGSPGEFNAIARAIRKDCRQAFALEPEPAQLVSLILRCGGHQDSIRIEGDSLYIHFTQATKNRLWTHFSMPQETPPGAMFFIDRCQGHVPAFGDDCLSLVLHVNATPPT